MPRRRRRNKRGSTFPRRERRGLIEADLLSKYLGDHGLFPRRERRGLIEASHACCGLLMPREFPRRERRGLIEAVRERRVAVSQRCFHGASAVASLKLGPRIQMFCR